MRLPGPVTGPLNNLVQDLTPQLGGTLDCQDKDLDNVKICTFQAEFDNGNSGAADTIDWNNGQKQRSTLTQATPTFTFTDPTGPCNLILKLIQDGSGSRNPIWPSSVKWPGGTEPSWSTSANEIDLVAFYFDGTDYFGTAILNLS